MHPAPPDFGTTRLAWSDRISCLLVRCFLWCLCHTVYRVRVLGKQYVPVHGPALLVSNHISLIDPLLIASCIPRHIRFVVHQPYYSAKPFGWTLRRMKAIPVSSEKPQETSAALECARHCILQGEAVCIFAEEAVSHTGNMLPFHDGFREIMKGLSAPVIPVHLDRLWGSIFSFKGGRFFWKWPERVPYPVTVSFGSALPPSAAVQEVRQAVMELGAAAVYHRRSARDLLHLRFLRTAKHRWGTLCMADSSGRNLTFGEVLIGSMVLARRIREKCRGQSMIGLLLPASVGGALANISAYFGGKIPVNLNFTVGTDAMESAITQCEIRTVLTSRPFLSKINLAPREGMIFLEDVLKSAGRVEKLRAALIARLVPARILERRSNRERWNPDHLATLIFTSGSSGAPKGVMLSHHNIISNAEAMAQVFWITRSDRFLGVLPFFHSFGFTCTLWFPLIGGCGVVFHPNPVDAKIIGELAKKFKATFLLSTPTFCSTYLRKCSAEEFASLRVVVVGGEKLRETVAKDFVSKFGLQLCEGYGCTEMAPVVAVNVVNPDAGVDQKGFRPGTAGQPLPGVVVKVVDPTTHALLAPGAEGLLMVKGPNRMIGYLGMASRTADALIEEWYSTGDIARLDADGFITITDRLARFSKIGGEMVPHIRIEEAINDILQGYACVVVAIPDEQKGERLAVLYTAVSVEPAQLWQKLGETNLPKLWIPKPDHFFQVSELPIGGTGKIDVRRAREIAMVLSRPESSRRARHAEE